MKLRHKISLGTSILRAKALRLVRPVIVVWAITYRCNKQCTYCRWHTVKVPELETKQVKLIIDSLCRCGLRMLVFTGGEPFLRNDIAEIVNYGKKKKLIVYINSNGSGGKDLIHDLRNLDCLTLSLEGTPVVHDSIRGAGSFNEVLESARLAQDKNIPFVFAATLNNLNLQDIEYLLALAADLKTKITFQLLRWNCMGSGIVNPLFPDSTRLHAALEMIYHYKTISKYGKIIGNSKPALKYLLRWPALPPLRCAAGIVTFRMNPQGSLTACADEENSEQCVRYLDAVAGDYTQMRHFFKRSQRHNEQCSCGCANRVEAALVWNLNMRAIVDSL